MLKAKTIHLKDMTFAVEQEGHKFMIDAAEQAGGKDNGPRPKGLLLSGVAGCTAMDVVHMLKKMRVNYDSFEVEAEADVSDEHPKVFKNIKITYRFKGKELVKNKIEEAVKLSQDKYCAVSAMLKKACDVSYEIVLEE